MHPRARIALFVCSGVIFAAVYALGLAGLPAFGRYPGPYGDVVNAVVTPERHVMAAVSGVNFDVRAFDTLGEQFIMFTAVAGVVLLLRLLKDESREEQEDAAAGRSVPPSSDAVRILGLALVGPLVVFGIYIVTHGHLSPGGGFQGGVILATAPLIVYLAGTFRDFSKVTAHALVEVSEAIGAGAYVLIGLGAMAAGGAFLQNLLPLGTTGDVFSAGAVPLISLAIGLEVAGAFVALLKAFVEEVIEGGVKEETH
jgi:multicomponent Na+:H+ antiporter subunit B